MCAFKKGMEFSMRKSKGKNIDIDSGLVKLDFSDIPDVLKEPSLWRMVSSYIRRNTTDQAGILVDNEMKLQIFLREDGSFKIQRLDEHQKENDEKMSISVGKGFSGIHIRTDFIPSREGKQLGGIYCGYHPLGIQGWHVMSLNGADKNGNPIEFKIPKEKIKNTDTICAIFGDAFKQCLDPDEETKKARANHETINAYLDIIGLYQDASIFMNRAVAREKSIAREEEERENRRIAIEEHFLQIPEDELAMTFSSKELQKIKKAAEEALKMQARLELEAILSERRKNLDELAISQKTDWMNGRFFNGE